MPQQKVARLQEKGQVTIPVDLRRRLGLKKGDLVAFVETEEGILIAPQELVAMKALDRIGEILEKEGLTLDQLIESGREIRGDLIKEKHRLDSE